MSSETIDWERLQLALSLEAEKGFVDLQGREHRFSEFLWLSLTESPPLGISLEQRRNWYEFGRKFSQYPELNLSQRQHLIAQTRRFLMEIKDQLEVKPITNEPKIPRTVSIRQKSPSAKALSLEQPLETVSGLGGNKGQSLKKLGLQNVKDLLFYYPRDYINYARQVTIKDLVAGETATIVGTVRRCSCFSSPKNTRLTIFELLLKDQSGQIKVSRFYAGTRYSNRGWQEKLKKTYPVGSIVAASGLVKANKYGLTLDNPEIEVLDSFVDSIESTKIGRVLPVYPLSEGIAADIVRSAVIAVLPIAKKLTDPLPIELKKQYQLVDLKEAIAQIHYPESELSLSQARRRLIFDEFFYLQLGFLQRRFLREQENQKALIFNPTGQLIESFNELLPFKLTQAQSRVIGEILQDLQSTTAMNRLVQGDVGSGKTIVAVYAILAALQSGYQAAFMAPTEVLAQQHYVKLLSWFNQLHLPIEILTGSTKIAKRRQIYRELETGELSVVVGTHALIQEKVNFQNLGLVVIDEQHRFGVQQRASLLSKGNSPHVLSMTATPIPRTLALTLHGDLDVSQIDELPPGRVAIHTKVLSGKERNKAYELIKKEVDQGRQAYVIFPVIEEVEKLDVRAAVEEHQKLSELIFPNFKVGLLHGKMSAAQKEEVLDGFRANQVQIIVSTTVIEVGVDVPNATVMLIENAERFGLSQLHQLRGRVGRGQSKSHCLLLSASRTPDAVQRLSVLEQSQDGFFISEMDMRLRGPGEVLGTRQSGLPDFALASLVEDQQVLILAREAAEKIIQSDYSLKSWPALKNELDARLERLLGADVLN